jgi:hypothetical protein
MGSNGSSNKIQLVDVCSVQLMSAVLTGLLFATGMPLMLLFSLAAVALQLASDRWMLRTICRRPPKYRYAASDAP